MRLRHIHLPSRYSHWPPYSLACRVQSYLRRALLDWKDIPSVAPSKPAPPPDPSPESEEVSLPPPPDGLTPESAPAWEQLITSAEEEYRLKAQQKAERLKPKPKPWPEVHGKPPPPPPTVISFTPRPVYTLGRRQHDTPLSLDEVQRLKQPLFCPPWTVNPKQHGNPAWEVPDIVRVPRGGLMTYHGPGQIVLWPVMDLKGPGHSHFTVRCYARLLENTTIGLLKKLWDVEAITTEDPGVWVKSPRFVSGRPRVDGSRPELAKIAALGVHLRRNVTGLGTALNVRFWSARDISRHLRTTLNQHPPSDQPVDLNLLYDPWSRFTPCGLENKAVTSLRGTLYPPDTIRAGLLKGGYDTAADHAERNVAIAWCDEFAMRIGLPDINVETVDMQEVVRMLGFLVGEAEEKLEKGDWMGAVPVEGMGEEGWDEEKVKEMVERERRYVTRFEGIYLGRGWLPDEAPRTPKVMYN
ncbi:lipoate-protein ligase-like protein [Thermochaetoides thermophila DSM 1495]|uniref:Lipoate-protein ligase-like protein n=1 Tax=Chaetomium thermophilum (strain DSM 1495 / CBS 144.50 / IMI 039719) TaxID=759272 RepID=G0RYY8_CHATD|nr:lipoate-protein ligase-like protein [Thermochaetoides thermophila DSM 1495]EGS23416.1 lipoate-protein ligase-like protein [Thermochaetoides thermophila DSM 1495]